MARITNREKIIRFLLENGINVNRVPWIIETKKYQRPGTLVINYTSLTDAERVRLLEIDYKPRDDGWFEHDPSCPIEVKGIRDHLEWQYGLNRIIWKGDK